MYRFSSVLSSDSLSTLEIVKEAVLALNFTATFDGMILGKLVPDNDMSNITKEQTLTSLQLLFVENIQ